MSVNFDQSQLESDLHQSGHPEQIATDNEEIGKYSPDEVDAGRPADGLPAVEQNCPPDSVREEALQTNDVQPQLGDAILPGGLKYGGTNFYKHEFAEKLCRSLPFIKSEPKHRVLKDWATDTEIFPQLGVSMNIQIKKEFDESGVSVSLNSLGVGKTKKVKIEKAEVIHKCEQCSEIFNKAPRLKRHLDKVHFKICDCPKCFRTFSTETNAKRHVMRCQGPKIKPEKKMMNETEGDNSSLSSKKQVKRWQCLICQKLLSSSKRVNFHFKSLHPSENPETNSHKINHINQDQKLDVSPKPKKEPKHKIPKKTLKTESRHQNGIGQDKSRRQSFTCKYCGGNSTRAHDLKRHIHRIHFTCTDCSTKFSNNAEIQEHLKVCDKVRRFKKIDLAAIDRRCLGLTEDSCRGESKETKPVRPLCKSEEDNVYRYKCFRCLTFYLDQFSLLRHAIEVHIKQYTCQQCPKLFSSQSKLANHAESCFSKQEMSLNSSDDLFESCTESRPKGSDGSSTDNKFNSDQTSTPLPTKQTMQDGLQPDISPIVQTNAVTNPCHDYSAYSQTEPGVRLHEDPWDSEQTEDNEDEESSMQTAFKGIKEDNNQPEFEDEETDVDSNLEGTVSDCGLKTTEVSKAENSELQDSGLGLDSGCENDSSLNSDESVNIEITPKVIKNKSKILKPAAEAAGDFGANKAPKKHFECRQCSKNFRSKQSLKDHVDVKHSNQYECAECDVLFSSRFYYEDHMRGMKQ